jgi:phage terminase large subunit-like protein
MPLAQATIKRLRRKAGDVSATAIAAAAPDCLLPEPEWITRAADESGYAWARIAWRRAAAIEGAWFDAAKADAVVAMWARIFCLTTKRFAGKPFRLSFWQEVIVRLLVGWKRPIDVIDEDTGLPSMLYVRLFQELRLWIPRKNGKSEFLAALALLFWAIEGEVRGQGYAFAHDEAQAREVFDKMGDMVGYMPAIAQDIRVLSKTLWIQKLKSAFRLLPGKAKGRHGKGPTVTVGDEMHEWKSRELAETLRQGEGTSLQPIRLYASTAGLRSQLVGKEMWDESLAILDGRVDDQACLVVIFAAEEDADWRDEKVWAAVNPSLGLSPTLQFLRSEFAKAQTPSGEAAFRRYHLNQWVEDLTRWLPLKKWDACVKDSNKKNPAWKRWLQTDELAGRECTLAFDSTWSFDFAAMVLRFAPKEAGEHPKFLHKFWLPSETIEQRVRAEQVAFDRWRDAGAIEEVPGGVFSVDWAVKAAKEFCQRFDVQHIGWDAWSAKEFYTRLVAEGVAEDRFVEMRFGTRSLGEASREYERMVFAGELDHGGHPVARWMAGHCHVRFDENMNFVPAKKKSGKKNSIDGIVGGVMTQALAMSAEAVQPSVYETRGIIEIEI